MNAVEVVRGGVVESRHRVHAVVAAEDGAVLGSVGDPELLTFYRSAAKPMQTLPLIEEGVADRLGLTPSELALCCASHEGERAHVEGARSILAKAGADEGLLRCGAHAPFSPTAAAELASTGRPPGRIHNNCSGKHAGMLALAIGMGWDPIDYHLPEHPVQRRMRDEMARWTGLPAEALPTAVDGCGVVCFAAPLGVMAASFARFAGASLESPGPRRTVAAMTEHPFMVGGTGRTCTDVMTEAPAAFVKLGAEGVYGGGVPERKLGLAIKVEDGGRRAVEVALVHVLRQIGVLDEESERRLAAHGRPDVRNTRDEIVGHLRPSFTLERPALGGD